jgi:hypothetical protein
MYYCTTLENILSRPITLVTIGKGEKIIKIIDNIIAVPIINYRLIILYLIINYNNLL